MHVLAASFLHVSPAWEICEVCVRKETYIKGADTFKHSYGRFRERGSQLPSSLRVDGVVFEGPDIICELSAATTDTHD
jgi:hypothetical protein